MLKRVGMQKELTLIGGVARQRGMIKALEERLQVQVHVPEDCDSVCALGAALLGRLRLAAGADSLPAAEPRPQSVIDSPLPRF
jgi:activator of 2-hydroxyglutaryl-CoA dehydratase